MDFGNLLGPKLPIYYCYLVSQMADFANGGVSPGPKIRHFRELTVLVIVWLSCNTRMRMQDPLNDLFSYDCIFFLRLTDKDYYCCCSRLNWLLKLPLAWMLFWENVLVRLYFGLHMKFKVWSEHLLEWKMQIHQIGIILLTFATLWEDECFKVYWHAFKLSYIFGHILYAIFQVHFKFA